MFRRENGYFFGKNVIQKSWSAKNVFVPPKLGARSPPQTIPAPGIHGFILPAKHYRIFSRACYNNNKY